MYGILLMMFGVWNTMGNDSHHTNRTSVIGQIHTPRLAWQMDMSACEYYLSVTPEKDNTTLDLSSTNLQSVPNDVWREYGIVPSLVDVLENGQPIIPPYAQWARWGKFLNDIQCLQRLSWTTTWGNDAHFQLHSFENGLENPRLVWDIPFGTMYSPLTVITDVDGDGSLEIALSVWHGVIVYNLATGQEKYRCMYRGELGRQYGFFGAYTNPSGKAYLVVVGDFAGHIGVLAVENGELKSLWVQEFDTQSIQGIDRRFTINTTGPDPIGDFNGDGCGEVLMNLFNNTGDGRWHLMVYDLETGKHSLDLTDVYLKGHADVDGDGVDELLVQKCNNRPVGTNGEIRIYKWDQIIWSHPYARWSMFTLPELALTHQTGAMRGMETTVIGSQNIVFFTASDEVERLYSVQFNSDLKPETLWEIESPSETHIDAMSMFGANTLIRVRTGNETALKINAKGVQIKLLGKQKLLRDAPQPLVLKDKSGRIQIVIADPIDRVAGWIAIDNILRLVWRQSGRAMTTSVPTMLGLTAGDIDGDGYDEVLSVQETPQGYSRLVALGLDGTQRWYYDFLEFSGRAPIWNETGTTLWALGHFSNPNRLDVLVSNRRSIMHSDETVVINPNDKSIIWHRDVLEVREPWTDTPWKHTRGYGGGVVGIADFDGDGLDDIAMCYPAEYSVINGYNGEQYALESTGPLKGTDNFWVIGGSPMIADFNCDGKPETLWSSSSIIIAFAHHGIKTEILWRTEPNDGAVGLPALGDTDGDGRLEIGLPGFKDGFRCLDPATGQMLWNVPPQGEGASNCVAVDINGDGIEEFVYANGSKLLAVAKRQDDNLILWQIDLPASIQNIVVDDIDGDGKAEILAGSRDGILYCVKDIVHN